ncbi:class I histocompatibility antigen, F10 alpha chain isoform X2 [Amia ocellicauda]|uniref:class I histocompatibility antigen, F10 alpha chain isoform X2 n=1 Tax=Amia ocellicauda TaxID=2972642 RepID=UPI003463C7CD
MDLQCLWLICCCAVAVDSERHSLQYIYTAMSHPSVSNPEFTAMGLLDDNQIDYYDSASKMKIPKQDWMREKLPADYWEKGTQSRRSKEQWFKVNVGILMDRMRDNRTDLHILQWRHGCEINFSEDSSVKFIRGYDQYSYDGADFLSFDESRSQWVAPVPPAEPTKRKWDNEQILNQYTKGYLERECVDWLTKFYKYAQKDIEKLSPPDVHVFAKFSLNPGRLALSCLATGFYPKDVQVDLFKQDKMLGEADGVQSSGVRSNGDETYQLRKWLEIPESDKEGYSCKVQHRSLTTPIIKKWEGDVLDCNRNSCCGAAVIGGLIVMMLVVCAVVVTFVLYKKKILVFQCSQKSEAVPQQHNPGQQNGTSNGKIYNGNGMSVQIPLISGSNGNPKGNGMSVEQPLMSVLNCDGTPSSTNGNALKDALPHLAIA